MSDKLTIEQIQKAVNELRNQQIDNMKMYVTPPFYVMPPIEVDQSTGEIIGKVEYHDGRVWWSNVSAPEYYGIAHPDMMHDLVKEKVALEIKEGKFQTVDQIVKETIDYLTPIEQSELIEDWYARRNNVD